MFTVFAQTEVTNEKVLYGMIYICEIRMDDCAKDGRFEVRGNSYTGHGIHVPARVMGQFAVFCPGYGSCFVNFALVIGLLYGDLPQLWINISNL